MPSPEPKRILVVDDEPSVCSLIGKAMEFHGMDCTLVTEATEAEKLLGTETYQAVLCDVTMPDVSGLELLKQACEHQPAAPFILMTGYGSVDDAKYAIRQGAYDYLEKPLEVDGLCHLVRRAMDDPTNRLRASRAAAAAGQRDGLTGLMTPRGLHERLGEIRLASLAQRDTCSVLIVDTDKFADANSMFGYAFGDDLLRRLADGLRGTFGDSTPICRFNSDEFVVVLPRTDEREAAARGEQVCDMVKGLSFQWNRHHLSVTVSVGVAEAGPGFSVTAEQLLANARRALREAKRAGGGAVRSFAQVNEGKLSAAHLVTSDLHEMAREASKIEHQLWLACLESVRALVSAVEAKDPYTRRHSDQVAYYAEHLARFMDLSGDEIETIRVAAMVHDVGKIGIPDTVLTKSGALSDEEFELIRQHPRMGAEILRKISMLNTESQLVLHHHERWDGRGYPDGIAGEDIPAGARIIQLADSIDAMLMRRTYKDPYPLEVVLSELGTGKGSQFAPDLADAAIEWLTAHPERVIRPAECGVG